MEKLKDKGTRWPATLPEALRMGLKTVVPSPLAGYTDMVYRRVLREYGARYVTYPFLSAHAVLANKPGTNRILAEIEDEENLIVQTFGGDPDVLGKAAKVIADTGAVGIDYNLGCSVKKIARSGSGAVMLKDLPLIAKCLKALSDAVDIPLSFKTRVGYTTEDKESSSEVLKMAQDCGFSYGTIHGRSFKQGFSGEANWEFIRQFKEKAEIPIIGSGDITGYKSCGDMIGLSDVDGVMIGRGIIGNPYMIGDCQLYVSSGEIPPHRTGRDFLDAALHHYRLALEMLGPDRGNKEMRKHLAKYIKSIRGATALRIRLNSTDDPAEVIRILEEAAALQPAVKPAEN